MKHEGSDGRGIFNKTTAGAMFRYAVKPDIIPRLRALGMHFGHFAYLIALVFQSANLLPKGHPATDRAHIGRYGMTSVIAMAANNLRWSWRHIDQVAIFGAVVLGLLMILVQAFIIMAMAVLSPAHAQTVDSFFTTPAQNVQTDVVLIMLEQVFGPNLDFFGTATQPLGTPVYEGLHAILGLYSLATMVIAVIIVVYYLVTVVGEAAKTGTPFGQRFNSLWAPIRLVVALGLLVPLGSGLNSAQYITLGIAKMGSGLGTTVWTQFVKEFTEATEIIAPPAGDSTAALVQRILFNEVCAAAYNQINEDSSRSVQILQVTGARSSIQPAFQNPDGMISAARDANMENIVLSWSNGDPGASATDYACGRISLNLGEFQAYSDGENVEMDQERWWWFIPFMGRDMETRLGEINESVKSAYLSEIGRLSEALRPAAEKIAAVHISVNAKPEYGDESALEFIPGLLREQARTTQRNINLTIQATYESITNSEFARDGAFDEMVKRGWGAAGLWYGTLGTINKRYMDAVASAIPTLDVLFEAADVTENERGMFARLFGLSRYGMDRGTTEQMENVIRVTADEFAGYITEVRAEDSPLYEDARYREAHDAGSGGWLSTSLLYILGGNQIRDMQNNPNLDPMVRLSAAGHAMITRSLISAGLGGAFGIGGALLANAPNPLAQLGGDLLAGAAVFLFAFAAIALLAGIFLAYVLPIIPFVYFAFAVIGWVLEIFEAIVAMPLWALAHLRIDGDGMPGQAAIGGYQLLLMILLRPALIVMGLIGGYVIFGAAAYFMGTLYNSATAITQSDIADNSIGALGTFVFTMIFAFLMYNLALMCFKMIDDVPKGLLRWLGSGAQAFSDSRGDPINGTREVLAGTVAAGMALKSGVEQSKATFSKRREDRNPKPQDVRIVNRED